MGILPYRVKNLNKKIMNSKFTFCLLLAISWLVMYIVREKDSYLILCGVWSVGAMLTNGSNK